MRMEHRAFILLNFLLFFPSYQRKLTNFGFFLVVYTNGFLDLTRSRPAGFGVGSGLVSHIPSRNWSWVWLNMSRCHPYPEDLIFMFLEQLVSLGFFILEMNWSRFWVAIGSFPFWAWRLLNLLWPEFFVRFHSLFLSVSGV